MAGILYGVGVGPGDPGLLTLKAVKIIKSADYIVVPRSPKEKSRAYLIASQAIPEIDEKKVLAFDFEMTKDKASLERIHGKVFDEIKTLLLAEKSVALLTIGDPTIYSTVSYIIDRVAAAGFQAEVVNGISSFSTAAAKLGVPLSEGDETLFIISGQREDATDIIESFAGGDSVDAGCDAAPCAFGTLVIMKCGGRIQAIKTSLLTAEAAGSINVYAISDVSLPAEKVFQGATNIPDDSGYMTTIIVKK